jgi:two-component system OmpR family response regulator
MRVLIIDDNQNITETLSFFFESNNIEPRIVNNSQNAVTEIKKVQYDLIILDLAMPDVSGFEVINHLKSEGLLQSQNVVILTAMPLSEAETASLLSQDGISRVMKKPLSIEDMEEIVAKVFEKKSQGIA